MDILKGLNPQQRAATLHVDGPLLVVAGAGTGKTQVITRRIARLIEQGKAAPTEVLALTFTEKAAREMADRLYELIGWQSFSVPVMTFNAFGAQLLAQYSFHIGRSIKGGLINDTQKALLLKQRLEGYDFNYYGPQADWYEFAVMGVNYIGRLQNAGVTPAAYRAYVDRLVQDPGELSAADVAEQQDLCGMYEAYEQAKVETATFDYYDQLAVPLAILTSHPNIAERVRRQYHHVLVDEYQDTSPVQDALLRRIVVPGGNVFAVGDDDQAIYGFRGADIANILDFTEHFKVQAPLALVQNYRSGQPILDAAYRLIRHNDPERLEVRLGLDKRLVAQTTTASVEFTPHRNAAAEQAAVVEQIEQLLGSGEAAASMAVLARSNATLQAYAKALGERHIPFAISTELSIFEQHELIQLWYLLEWIGQRASDEAIAHVAVGPLIGLTAARWRPIMERMRERLCDAETALRSLAADGDAAVRRVTAWLDTWRAWAQEETATRLAVRVISEPVAPGVEPLTTQLQRLAAEKPDRQPRITRVFDDLQRFLSHIDSFTDIQELAGGDKTLVGYLAQYPRPPRVEVSETLGEADGVQLLTIHAAKGLEFDTVFLVNLTARAWSEQGAGNGPQPPEALVPPSELPPVHEQRRLMYVAITRARHALRLSAPVQTAGGQRQALSPLVAEALGHEPTLKPANEVDSSDNMMKKIQHFYPLALDLPDRLPFETADGWLELGVGDLELYSRSPHDFYIERVLGMTRPFGPQLAFGSAIHRTIEQFYKARLQNVTPPIEELLNCLEQQWSDRGYETRAQAEAAYRRAEETVRRFHQREMTHERRVLSSEQPIRFELPEAKLRLKGRLDATFALDEGVEIRDFKTGQQRDADKVADKAKTSFQLRTYALALEELTGHTPAQVTLDYVVTGVEGSAKLTPLILKNHRQKLVELAVRLRARDFAPGSASTFHQPAALRYYGETDSEEDAAEVMHA